MRAMVIDGYGGADGLRPDERPDPVPGPGELLVDVRAASVNPVDWKIRRGDLKLILHLGFPYIPGGDIAGEVAAVGPGVTRFRPGDAVAAFVDLKRGGGYASRAVVNESAAAAKPGSLSFAQAACLPIAGCTALQALRDHGRLLEGDSALITGGAGGVGHFGVQVAAAMGATVTSTCGPSNVEFVRSLGAGRVIDYTREDFTRLGDRYHVILDAVAASSFGACRGSLHPGGAYVTTVPGPGTLFWSAVQTAAGLVIPGARRARFLWAKPEGADIAALGRLADDGRVTPTVSHTFRLEQAAEAHRLSEQGHVRGKIVLEV